MSLHCSVLLHGTFLLLSKMKKVLRCWVVQNSFVFPSPFTSSTGTKLLQTVGSIIIEKYGYKMYVSVLVKFVMITKGKKIQQQWNFFSTCYYSQVFPDAQDELRKEKKKLYIVVCLSLLRSWVIAIRTKIIIIIVIHKSWKFYL